MFFFSQWLNDVLGPKPEGDNFLIRALTPTVWLLGPVGAIISSLLLFKHFTGNRQDKQEINEHSQKPFSKNQTSILLTRSLITTGRLIADYLYFCP